MMTVTLRLGRGNKGGDDCAESLFEYEKPAAMLPTSTALRVFAFGAFIIS